MSIFAYAIFAHTLPPFIIVLVIIGLFYLAQKVFYHASINCLELRARWHSQIIDHQKQQLALAMPKQNLIEWANWYVAHQNDIGIELLPDRIKE